jgi:signal peptidase II
MKRAEVIWSNGILAPGQLLRTAPVLALLAVGVDQVTKSVVRENLTVGDSISLSANLHIANVANPGIVFGVPAPAVVSLLLPLLLMVASLGLYRRFEGSGGALLNIGTGLYIGSTLGNLIDRIAYGQVTDFIGFTVSGGQVGWVFNLADVFAVLGIIILEVFLVRVVLKRWGRRSLPLDTVSIMESK